MAAANVRGWIIVAGFIVSSVGGNAKLTWDSVSLAKSVSLTEDTVMFEFPFKNEHQKPLSILMVHPLCSCTTAKADKTTYGPGGEGIVEAVFTVGQRTGTEIKFVDVTTSDGDTQRLTFTVKMPEVATLIPNYLLWKVDQPLISQEMELKVKESAPVQVLSTRASNKGYKVELVILRQGFDYKIKVTPLHATPVKATIYIKTDYPSAKPREYDGEAEIMPQDTSQRAAHNE